MKRVVGAAVIGAVLMTGVAACGSGKPAADDKKSHSSSQDESSASGSSSPNPADSKTPGPSSSDGGSAGKKLTLSGTVHNGPEEGCVLLKYKGTTYRLIGSTAQKLHGGDRVELTGEIAGDSMSTCQTGTPFKVKTAKVIH
ncbi:MAG TPA: hypothetical protein VE172_16035 [Stackebrandtia sp.]|uniref:hypothetical protein n=1 Tax=Stackebrandtia sp. TaxID=2023065 RepID=UPI002D2FA84E|nr:hypothetical protein [Stackebrandtia sp.]HZE40314.1 hypothetical protein [Stackebrandtia sp.]